MINESLFLNYKLRKNALMKFCECMKLEENLLFPFYIT